jgi:hypothetical protein
MRPSILVLATLSLTVLGCARRQNRVDGLPGISELRIVDQRTVYMTTPGGMLNRLSKDGGLIEDRHYIDAETGALKLSASARRPNEVTITIGEQASTETGFGGHCYQLLEIRGETVHLHHTEVSRQGQRSERDITVLPYQILTSP